MTNISPEGTFELGTLGIAELYSLFETSVGAQFGPSYVATHTPLLSNDGPTQATLNIPLNSHAILAYWDDRSASFESTPTPDDLYGWVEVTNTASGLIASDGVAALGGGIIVGTATQLPEPAALLLLGLAIFSLSVGTPRTHG